MVHSHTCRELFLDFTFDNISRAKPPNQTGVYCIKALKRGLPTWDIEKEVANYISLLRSEMVEGYLVNRIHQLHNISRCPIMYIGSAGTNTMSKHTLAGRYQDFKLRHTIQYPDFWALLYFGWGLHYGWTVTEAPSGIEGNIKTAYKDRHHGKLPALVSR